MIAKSVNVTLVPRWLQVRKPDSAPDAYEITKLQNAVTVQAQSAKDAFIQQPFAVNSTITAKQAQELVDTYNVTILGEK